MSNEIANRNDNLPDYIQPEDEGMGVEELTKFVKPPRIRVVQALSEELTVTFTPGDTIIMPSRTLLAPVHTSGNNNAPSREKFNAGETWQFTPIFFWPEWVKWNAREDENGPMILDVSQDPTSELAAKCRDREKWFEDHETVEGAKVRNVEHLNFIVVPHSGEGAGEPCILSFSRSEHRAGTAFAGLIKMRRGPLFGGIYNASTGYRSNTQGNWYGIDVRNPDEDEPRWVEKATYEFYRDLHEEFKNSTVQVDYADEESSDEATVDASVGDDTPF